MSICRRQTLSHHDSRAGREIARSFLLYRVYSISSSALAHMPVALQSLPALIKQLATVTNLGRGFVLRTLDIVYTGAAK